MFPPPAEAAPNVDCYKGVAVRELIDWCAATFGEESVREAIGGLAPGERRLFDVGRDGYGVLHGGWYPATAVNGTLDALLAGVPVAEQARLARGAAGLCRQVRVDAARGGRMPPGLAPAADGRSTGRHIDATWRCAYRALGSSNA